MNLFTPEIHSWSDWSGVFQSVSAFTPLVRRIFESEGLPLSPVENLTPGTNAVFKVGQYVAKLYAPTESGMDQTSDLQTELFAMRRARDLGLSVPEVVSSGFIDDKYRFAYIIMEYIDGVELAEAVIKMTDAEKTSFGRRLRQICDTMNTPCEAFNDIDILTDKDRQIRWEGYPGSFKAERDEYIRSHDFGERVFVHGDIGGDNIILSKDGGIYILDFADAVLAPAAYEHSLVAIDVFTFDPALLRGFFGDYTVESLTDICFDGLLIHDFGGDTVEEHICAPRELNTLADLRRKIEERIRASAH